jgi:hypothetical protein
MRIGISGHQTLREGSRDWAWIEAAMREIARERGITVAVSSLAAGADQRFARVALSLGADLEAVVPCRGYAEVFEDPRDRADYETLLLEAKAIHRLNHKVCNETAFLAAGIDVVARCDMLVALWDGQPVQGLGGTADIVAHATRLGRSMLHIDPHRGTIIYH